MPSRPPVLPTWMEDIDIPTLHRINEIANQLIDEGYSEEQAYLIAYELGQEWDQDEDEEGPGALSDEIDEI